MQYNIDRRVRTVEQTRIEENSSGDECDQETSACENTFWGASTTASLAGSLKLLC